MRVHLRGEGVAAACCAALLSRTSNQVTIERISPRQSPVALLSDQALALLRDVLDQPALWSDLPRVDRRVVAWGSSDPVAMPHAATMVPGSALRSALELAPHEPASAASFDFTIHAATPVPFGETHRFGARQGNVIAVHVISADDRSTCWIEAVAGGWLFLVPATGEDGWLLGVGQPIDLLLGDSRLIAPRIRPAGEPAASFDTSPAMLAPPRTSEALACGSAALTFDPICGDGTAQAAREAILASAVITGIGEGGDVEELLSHYDAMLTAAMRRHLALCVDHYRSGGDSGWWQEQVASLTDGHAWCTARLARMPEPRFRLKGDRLVARELAA